MPDAITLETYDWADQGDRPNDPSVSSYTPGEEPLAETDNDWNTSVRNDLKNLNTTLGTLQSQSDSIVSDLNALTDRVNTLRVDFENHNHDNRYYRQSVADDKFYPKSGGLIDGAVTTSGSLFVNGAHADLRNTNSVIYPVRDAKPANPQPGASFVLE